MGKREILHALRERVNGGAGAAPQRMSVAVEAVKRSVALPATLRFTGFAC